MKEFIEFLLKSIVSKPEEVLVTEEIDPESHYYNYIVKVSQDDMGMVIGKEGKTIRSIRSLTRAKAIKDRVKINIELVETQVQTDVQ
jgi:predicted RNA-binding protein YlqC (UPF0109 family)